MNHIDSQHSKGRLQNNMKMKYKTGLKPQSLSPDASKSGKNLTFQKLLPWVNLAFCQHSQASMAPAEEADRVCINVSFQRTPLKNHSHGVLNNTEQLFRISSLPLKMHKISLQSVPAPVPKESQKGCHLFSSLTVCHVCFVFYFVQNIKQNK